MAYQGGGRRDAAPPPHKKSKRNLVITRYPPPLGYLSHGQPVAPQAQHTTWSTTATSYSGNSYAWTGYPQPSQPFNSTVSHTIQAPQDNPFTPNPYGSANSGYNAQPAQVYAPLDYVHQTCATQGHTSQSFAAQPYSSQSPTSHIYAQQPYAQQPQGPAYPTTSYGQYQNTHSPTHLSPYSAWSSQFSYPQSSISNTSNHSWSWSTHIENGNTHSRRFSNHTLPTTPVSAEVSKSSNSQSMPANDVTSDDPEDEFTAECYYAHNPNEIVPTLSLGLIEWKSAVPTKRALPATFKEAELEAIAPRDPPSKDELCVSEYFASLKGEEALLSVRETPLWQEVKDDIIFKLFPRTPDTILPLRSVIATYRDRRDGSFVLDAEIDSTSSTPEPEIMVDECTDVSVKGSGVGLNNLSPSVRAMDVVRNNSLDNLEEALLPANDSANSISTNRKRKHSESSANSSIHPSDEKICATTTQNEHREQPFYSLNVSGSPSGHSPRINNPQSSRPPPPPPPPRQNAVPPEEFSPNMIEDRILPWPCNGTANGHHADRPVSRQSDKTAVGSDFHLDSSDDTLDHTDEVKQQLRQVSGQKRNFEDSDDEPADMKPNAGTLSHNRNHKIARKFDEPRHKAAKANGIPR